MDLKKIEKGVRLIIEGIGEDPERAGIKDTPERVARMYQEIFSGLETPTEELLSIIEGESHDEMVLLKDIPFYSVCEHHLIPFFGKVCATSWKPSKTCWWWERPATAKKL